MLSTEASYTHCRGVARRCARNFYYAFLPLPREQHDALCAIYAFMRRTDDLADDPGAPVARRQADIEAWRERLRSALEGDRADGPVLPAFCDAVARFSIPHNYFSALLDGMERDLSGRAYETFDELYDYCYQAASVVGMTTIHVLGFDHDGAIPLAEKCGVAFQLTNILRDISADARMGRVYFPSAELSKFGIDRHELLGGDLDSSDERFQRFMAFQWHRANSYYEESRRLLAMIDPSGRPSFWAMVAIYRGLLHRIRSVRYAVLDRRVGLPTWRKLWILAQALRFRVTGGTPRFPA